MHHRKGRPVIAFAAAALFVALAGCTSAADSTSASTVTSAIATSVGSSAGFLCPSVNDINALAAVTLVAAPANNSRNCQYTATNAGVADTIVVLQHPPVGLANQGAPTLAQVRAQLEAAGQVEISIEPHYSSAAFIARSGTQSCTVFVLARDEQVMSVQEFHTASSPVASCAIAESVVALAGTAASMAPASGSAVVSPAPASPAPATTSTTSPAAAPTSSASTTTPPSASKSTAPSEVPVFSTGPAASYQLPTASR